MNFKEETPRQYFDEAGRELPSSDPVAQPVHLRPRGNTLDEIRRNLGIASQLAAQEGMETFDEADDFEVGDDFEGDHPFAERVDNMNRMYEELRGEIRDAVSRGEIRPIHQPDGSVMFHPNPQYRPPGGMGVVDPHAGPAPVPPPPGSPAPPAPPAPTAAPAP